MLGARMLVNSKKLTGLRVVTKSAAVLGRVASLDIDSESGRIETFRVRTRGLVAGLLEGELMVHWSQVVEMTEKELVVSDAAIPAGARIAAHASGASSGAGVSASTKTG